MKIRNVRFWRILLVLLGSPVVLIITMNVVPRMDISFLLSSLAILVLVGSVYYWKSKS